MADALTEDDLRDLERRASRPCPGCGTLPDAHEASPATILYCRDCPDASATSGSQRIESGEQVR